jgi:hypothetical protein
MATEEQREKAREQARQEAHRVGKRRLGSHGGRAATTKRPETVAVGTIQLEHLVYVEVPNDKAELSYHGMPFLVLVRNVPGAADKLANACKRFSMWLCGRPEGAAEGTFLVLFPRALERGVGPLEAFLRHLEGMRVTEPQREHGAYTIAGGKVPLLVAVEWLLTGGRVTPTASGSGGKEGVRYHPLHTRQEATGVENTCANGEEAETSSATGSSRHAGITGRSHVPGPKRGYGN